MMEAGSRGPRPGSLDKQLPAQKEPKQGRCYVEQCHGKMAWHVYCDACLGFWRTRDLGNSWLDFPHSLLPECCPQPQLYLALRADFELVSRLITVLVLSLPCQARQARDTPKLKQAGWQSPFPQTSCDFFTPRGTLPGAVTEPREGPARG